MIDRQLIGIFGSGRNGSTLLTRLLDGISGAYIHPVESNFLSALNDLAVLPVVRRATIQNATTKPLNRLHKDITTRRLLRFYGAHFREIEERYLSELPTGAIHLTKPASARLAEKAAYKPAAFVEEFLAATSAWLGGGPEVRHFFFKTIETAYISAYEATFPQMRFIHIVRDPLAVWASAKRSMASYKKLPPWYLAGDNFRVTLECRWIPHAEAIVSRRGDPRHMVIRYEELVKDAEGKVLEICKWLELPAPLAPDTQTLLGGHHPRSMGLNPSQKGVETPRQVVANLHERFTFEPVVTDRERAFIRLRTAALADALGYGGGESLPDPNAVYQSWREVDEWDAANTRGLWPSIRSAHHVLGRRRYIKHHCQALRITAQ